MTKKKKGTFDPHDEEFLKKWALDYFKDRIFTSSMIKEHDQHLISTIFMVLLFADDALRKEIKEVTEAGNFGLIYEYMSEAGPRSVNGYPMFLSCRFLCKQDVEKVKEYLKELEEVEAKFRGGSKNEK